MRNYIRYDNATGEKSFIDISEVMTALETGFTNAGRVRELIDDGCEVRCMFSTYTSEEAPKRKSPSELADLAEAAAERYDYAEASQLYRDAAGASIGHSRAQRYSDAADHWGQKAATV